MRQWGLLIGALALLVEISAGVAVAQPNGSSTIVSSSGPSAGRYPAGARLPRGAVLFLRPGDSVVVARGEFARVFRGPGRFVADDFAANGQSRPRRPTTGPSRGSGTPPSPHPSLGRFVICPGHPRCPR